MNRATGRAAITFAVLILSCMLAACSTYHRNNDPAFDAGTVQAASIGDVSFRVLHKADYNLDDRPTSKSFLVLAEAVAYAAELKKYSVEFPATINFSTDLVILATMGTQVSGGYAIGAVKAEEYSDKVVVQFELVSPANNCLTTEAQSNPYEFLQISTRKRIEFIERSRIALCDE